MSDNIPILQLTPEETAEVSAFFKECDARAEGFRLGMETAKKMEIQRVLQRRQEKDKNGNLPQ